MGFDEVFAQYVTKTKVHSMFISHYITIISKNIKYSHYVHKIYLILSYGESVPKYLIKSYNFPNSICVTSQKHLIKLKFNHKQMRFTAQLPDASRRKLISGLPLNYARKNDQNGFLLQLASTFDRASD